MSTYLRLAGPLQSWAGPTTTAYKVATGPVPTKSGIVGMLAGALGMGRGEYEDWLQDVKITVRVDNPGEHTYDLHSIGPNPERADYMLRMTTIHGKPKSDWKLTQPYSLPGVVVDGKVKKINVDMDKRVMVHGPVSRDSGTALIDRVYLAGAEFILEIGAGENEERLAAALREPVWSPYLGRKAFTPTAPFYLGRAEAGLLDSLPTVAGGEEAKELFEVTSDYPKPAGWARPPQVEGRKEHLIALARALNTRAE